MSGIESMSPVKREKLKKQERLNLKNKMRAALPVLNKEEIRRYRLPYHEAVLLELQEQGFVNSAEYLKELIDYQEDLRREHGPDSAVSSKPRLLENRKQIDILYNKLKTAENAHYQGDIGTECQEFIKLGAIFGLGPEGWWWLGEQLLIQAVTVCSNYRRDGGKCEAISKYIYGKFLFENILDPEKAKAQLIEARQISMGKSWKAPKGLENKKQDTVFVESCILIYKALLAEAALLMADDPVQAARLCYLAKKRATDACDHVGEADALMLEGLCEMEAGNLVETILLVKKVLALETQNERHEQICEARIRLALANLRLRRFTEVLMQLEILLDFATSHNLEFYVGQAFRYLGEYYLNQGKAHLATPLLIKALNTFQRLEDLSNSQQARNLAAVSAGQELMSKYVHLMLKSGKKDGKGVACLLKLVRWKDVRELFWMEGEEDSITSLSASSFEQSLMNLSNSEYHLTSVIDESEEDLFNELTHISKDTPTVSDVSHVEISIG